MIELNFMIKNDNFQTNSRTEQDTNKMLMK